MNQQQAVTRLEGAKYFGSITCRLSCLPVSCAGWVYPVPRPAVPRVRGEIADAGPNRKPTMIEFYAASAAIYVGAALAEIAGCFAF